jgi:hypothetical protein
MEKKKMPGSLNYYLCPGQRYKLSWIRTIDDEAIVLRSLYVFSDITFFTKSYKYRFHREKDDRDKDAANFIERIKMNESDLALTKLMETPIQFDGRDYTYSEEKWCFKLGDYPRFEERMKRIRERINFYRNFKKE